MPAPLLSTAAKGLASLLRGLTSTLLSTLFCGLLAAFSCSHLSILREEVCSLIRPPGGTARRHRRVKRANAATRVQGSNARSRKNRQLCRSIVEIGEATSGA